MFYVKMHKTWMCQMNPISSTPGPSVRHTSSQSPHLSLLDHNPLPLHIWALFWVGRNSVAYIFKFSDLCIPKWSSSILQLLNFTQMELCNMETVVSGYSQVQHYMRFCHTLVYPLVGLLQSHCLSSTPLKPFIFTSPSPLNKSLFSSHPTVSNIWYNWALLSYPNIFSFDICDIFHFRLLCPISRNAAGLTSSLHLPPLPHLIEFMTLSIIYIHQWLPTLNLSQIKTCSPLP